MLRGRVSADGTSLVGRGWVARGPGLEADAVKDVLARYGHEAVDVIHALETDGTCWEFNEVGGRRREGLQVIK